MRAIVWAVLTLWLSVLALPAQDLSALARLDPERSAVSDRGDGVVVTLGLSQAVPWRLRLMAAPPRLVLDFREVDWRGYGDLARASVRVKALRAGMFRPGWSRLVLELDGPYRVAQAGMMTDGPVQVRVRLEPASAAEFAASVAQPEPEGWALPPVADLPRPLPQGAGPLVVVLDPGHGGIDPGAERGDASEAALVLTFARELKEALLRDGNFAVVMTRAEDVFVPLEARISLAREAAAQVFLSLHADALAEGEAVGASLYTLSDEATDAASAALAERHDRDDLLAGVDLTGQDDVVATVLMDMARTETMPRTDRLAQALVTAITAADLTMYRHPRQQAGFSVLKSPDIPSVLLELGFLSSPGDLARLRDPDWRARMVAALVGGLKTWAAEDAALAGLLRR
ncbi:MAG: N-acetylmuramoyl-L-alanine amidase [Rhodobacterales bacterium]|nr:N-acetylmuramoyl-L-alanine amidase [Rhodobacterales bacterium]